MPFIEDKKTDLGRLKPTDVRRILLSINKPLVAMPEHPSSAAKSAILFVEKPAGAYYAFIILYLISEAEKFTYSYDRRPIRQSDLEMAEEEALGFVESMGFIMDPSDFDQLDADEQMKLLRTPPFVKGQPEAKPTPKAEPSPEPEKTIDTSLIEAELEKLTQPITPEEKAAEEALDALEEEIDISLEEESEPEEAEPAEEEEAEEIDLDLDEKPDELPADLKQVVEAAKSRTAEPKVAEEEAEEIDLDLGMDDPSPPLEEEPEEVEVEIEVEAPDTPEPEPSLEASPVDPPPADESEVEIEVEVDIEDTVSDSEQEIEVEIDIDEPELEPQVEAESAEEVEVEVESEESEASAQPDASLEVDLEIDEPEEVPEEAIEEAEPQPIEAKPVEEARKPAPTPTPVEAPKPTKSRPTGEERFMTPRDRWTMENPTFYSMDEVSPSEERAMLHLRNDDWVGDKESQSSVAHTIASF